MGKRVLFTQKEIQKYSKTYEGRQYMNTKRKNYGVRLVFAGILGAIFCLIITKLSQMQFFLFYLIICLGVIVYGIWQYFVWDKEYKREYRQEILRYEEEQKQKKLQQDQERKRYLLNQERKRNLSNACIEQIDAMSGFDFEEYCTNLLKKLGYKAITTKKSGDFGADIVAQNQNEKIVVQTKRYTNKVSISSVQEIVAAKNYYHANSSWIITNNYFTQSAQKLARYNDVKLIDRDELAKIIVELNKNNKGENYDYSRS